MNSNISRHHFFVGRTFFISSSCKCQSDLEEGFDKVDVKLFLFYDKSTRSSDEENICDEKYFKFMELCGQWLADIKNSDIFYCISF